MVVWLLVVLFGYLEFFTGIILNDGIGDRGFGVLF